MQLLYTILIMLVVVSGTRITAQFIPVPLPLLQILIGALLAVPALGLHVRLEPELFLLLFIPPLLFVDGWRMPKGQFRELRTPILLLAFALVFFTILGAGCFIHWLLPQVPLAACFALAAVLSPTDAVAVSAITHGRLPSTLSNMLQGEALMNDASGLVAFKFAVAATLTGVFSLTDASVQFVIVAVGGVLVGVALSSLLGRLRAWMIARGWEDPAPHVLMLLLLPFAAYVAAEHFGLSGILSAVAAGMMQSRLDLLPRQTTTRLLNRSVWMLLEFTFNGLIFLLLGLQLPDILTGALALHHEDPWLFLLKAGGWVVAIYVVLMLLRFVWVYAYWRMSGAFRRWRGVPTRFAGQSRGALSLVLTFGGVRGAVTLAGVMSLPLLLNNGADFPERPLLILIAAGVILLSLLVASIALPRILPYVPQDNLGLREKQFNQHRAHLLEAAIRALEEVEEHGSDADAAVVSVNVKAKLMAEYHELLERTQQNAQREREHTGEEAEGVEYRLRLLGLRTQRAELYRLRKEHQLDDDVLMEILRDLDIAEARLQHHH